ncbi:NAD(P)-dependent oxidoreductase (plasmid) [Azospirillum oryzae]|uniref:dihydrouracil dehydrogenase (NAD(+)) n=1 Tax=Azospirillum oryzae TaxID=286727 RepID=A0A6N1AFI9_9PROT|nr:NAD(P)-dependent oxidoreductase [Azospirillum oryzae]KAA0585578.1 NAD(P)-dependent oxidoreductase [Azospirillum oryzae]QKS50270.1 NAD(P)-dependent oxidoreductase [Azospirillum oryzae]GLR80846.1 oxidoreductase [Azospirillum oryzae]
MTLIAPLATAPIPAEDDRASPYVDLSPAMTPVQALAESNRCLFCYDAPCIKACPTGIDIPAFIRSIATGNLKGAATTILSENIMGGTCGRVCPTETLCEQSCVRNRAEDRPVAIGRLQRHATDRLIDGEPAHPFPRAAATGKRVAVVGAGPAGLSCAHRLATLGHEVTVFEAKAKSGGLNEYGLAPYKMADDFAQREVAFILGVGGISVEHGRKLGADLSLDSLRADFDAVFLGVGLGSNNRLGIPGEERAGVEDATAFIERVRQAPPGQPPAVGRSVVVIGGGNTAIDAAIQAKRLGAEDVTLVYRRGRAQMGATAWEQELAQTEGVVIKTFAAPSVIGETDITFERTRLTDGKLSGTGETFTLQADMVLKAVGQKLSADALDGLQITGGKIAIDEAYRTTLSKVWAGGDCVATGEDLTVQSVQDGKLAALAIHSHLTA